MNDAGARPFNDHDLGFHLRLHSFGRGRRLTDLLDLGKRRQCLLLRFLRTVVVLDGMMPTSTPDHMNGDLHLLHPRGSRGGVFGSVAVFRPQQPDDDAEDDEKRSESNALLPGRVHGTP